VIHILLPFRGARARLAHRQRADMLAGDELRQVLLALRLAAVPADLVDAEIGMRAVGQCHRGRGTAQLLDGDDVREVAERRSAVVFLDRDAEQAERAELRPQIHRKFVAAIDFRCARRNFLRREVLHRGAQHVDRLAVVESQERVVHGHLGVGPRPAGRVAAAREGSGYFTFT